MGDKDKTARSSASLLNRDLTVCALIAALTILVYAQVGGHGFINFDDPDYVSANPHVNTGLTADNVRWAIGLPDRQYWAPLSWLSHMTDVQLFGLNPGMHHLVNVAFHVLNALLLFAALRMMTGSRWRSAFAAALFALHPVNVDSVAWISERKNLLSTTFWLLSMILYVRYSRLPGLRRYAGLVCVFTLGLLAKQMLVTLPFVFLLLDYWPLGRIRFGLEGGGNNEEPRPVCKGEPLLRLVLEKLPLLVLSLAAIAITSHSIKQGGFTITYDMVPLALRLENAVVSYAVYLGKLLWPVSLMFYYPYPTSVPAWQVVSSSVLVVLLTALAAAGVRKYPYLTVGWLWFTGTLVPVSGIMQGGLWPAVAERWAYVPFIGLFIAMSWGLAGLAERYRFERSAPVAAAVTFLLILAVLTARQAGFWKDDLTLFSHAVEIDPDNVVAQTNLGKYYEGSGDNGKAIEHYLAAIGSENSDTMALGCLASLYSKMGERDKALSYFSQVVSYKPDDASAYMGMGYIYADRSELDRAAAMFSRAAEVDPRRESAYYSLGIVLAKKGEKGRAGESFRKALELDPADGEAHSAYGVLLMSQGNASEAISHFRETLRIDPRNQEAAAYLNTARGVVGKGGQELAKLERESLAKPGDAGVLGRLAVAYSMAGDNARALETLKKLQAMQPGNPNVYYNMACIHAKQGDADGALALLGLAVDKGFKDRKLLETDPDLSGIRGKAGFRELLEKKGL